MIDGLKIVERAVDGALQGQPVIAANALLVLVRRRKLTDDERQTGLRWLAGLRIKLDHEMGTLAFSPLSELAAVHDLSVYDAACLELALRRRLPLGCKDGPVQAAARRGTYGVGVSAEDRAKIERSRPA